MQVDAPSYMQCMHACARCLVKHFHADVNGQDILLNGENKENIERDRERELMSHLSILLFIGKYS